MQQISPRVDIEVDPFEGYDCFVLQGVLLADIFDFDDGLFSGILRHGRASFHHHCTRPVLKAYSGSLKIS